MTTARGEVTMITFIRTVQAMPGKVFDAIAWGKEGAAVFKRVTGRELSVSLAFGGNVTELAFISHYDNAAQIEETFAKLLADREYVSFVKKAEGLTIPGTGHDHLWKSV
jgi:hypothetical protein